MILAPDRPEASAADCEHLAAHPDSPDRVRIADALLFVPLLHPQREVPDQRLDDDGNSVTVYVDRVLAMSEAIRHRRETPEALRAFAGDLRDGAAEMCGRGWMHTLYGVK